LRARQTLSKALGLVVVTGCDGAAAPDKMKGWITIVRLLDVTLILLMNSNLDMKDRDRYAGFPDESDEPCLTR